MSSDEQNEQSQRNLFEKTPFETFSPDDKVALKMPGGQKQQVNIYLRKDWLLFLKNEAFERGLKVSTYICLLLGDYVKRDRGSDD